MHQEHDGIPQAVSSPDTREVRSTASHAARELATIHRHARTTQAGERAPEVNQKKLTHTLVVPESPERSKPEPAMVTYVPPCMLPMDAVTALIVAALTPAARQSTYSSRCVAFAARELDSSAISC